MTSMSTSSPAAAMIYQHAATDRDRLIADGLDGQAQTEAVRKVVGWVSCWVSPLAPRDEV